MRCLTVLCAFAAASAPTWAAAEVVLYSTGYEPPTYSVGPLTGNDNWVAFFANAEVTSNLSLSGSQSVVVDKANEFAQRGGSFSTAAPIVTLRQAVYIDGPDEEEFLQEGFFIRPFGISGDNPNNVDEGGFVGQLLVVNGEGPLGLGATIGLADGVPNAGFVPVDVGEWFVLEHVLNLETQTQEAYVDGQFIASAPFVNSANELSGVEFVVLNTPDHVIYFDDMSITAIPEPGSVALLGLGGLAMLGLRVRRR